ncbi:unnamed protein product [Phytomonas sp. EM1]|nr:unnamed protein product [Phytomonas sp. EM1]|eukprot:CCW65164.1 unnamed protein product [Phytomonas sp. isolate EM1]
MQFHAARCDASVNYYFRSPGNPGDLSRIPDYASAHRGEGDGKGKALDQHAASRQPSSGGGARWNGGPPKGGRRAPGVEAEEVSEPTTPCYNPFTSFAEEWAAAKVETDPYPSREALYRGVIESNEETLFETDQEMRAASARERAHGTHRVGNAKPSRVLPVMCAVAFLREARKPPTGGEPVQGSGKPVMLSSYPTCSVRGVNTSRRSNYTVNVVGCFGFTPIQDEVDAVLREDYFMRLGSIASATQPGPRTCRYSPSTPLQSSLPKGGRHPLNDPRTEIKALRGGTSKMVDLTLPPSVAAPLASIVFLTKSASEQRLSHVVYVAASTYYFQMIHAGVIARGPNLPRPSGSAPHPYHSATSSGEEELPPPPYAIPSSTTSGSSPSASYLPPMETFSFSTLLTSVPALSFLYEMRSRWGYLGVLKSTTPAAHSNLISSTSTPPQITREGEGEDGQDVAEEIEMWITANQMLHCRISGALAARLCWSLAEHPEVLRKHTLPQLASEEASCWRYRGLVDRAHPPPLPNSLTTIHPQDVYVMGRDVIRGFDEGDILRFDTTQQVWLGDHSIPLEGVILVVMRPYCKKARESDSKHPGWVTRLVRVEKELQMTGGVKFPVSPPSPEQAAVMEAHPGRYTLVHELRGNFFVYRFECNGTTYYHGTVPDFANPNKKQLMTLACLYSLGISTASEPSPLALLSAPANADKTIVSKILYPPKASTEQRESSHHKMRTSPSMNGHSPKQMFNVLFPDPRSIEDDPMTDLVLAAFHNAPTSSAGNRRGGSGSPVSPPPALPNYLINRVTSAALETPRTLMFNLYCYAHDLSMGPSPLVKTTYLADPAPPPPYVDGWSVSSNHPSTPRTMNLAPCRGSSTTTTATTTTSGKHSCGVELPSSPTGSSCEPPHIPRGLMGLLEMDSVASKEGGRSCTYLSLTQAPKRYMEKTKYVWDWRLIKSVNIGNQE